MFETSAIYLSKKALKNNLQFIRQNISKDTRLCCVIKGNAYGHGISQYARLAMSCGVTYFAVHAAEEAYELMSNLEKKPDIFVIGAAGEAALEWIIQSELEIAVFDFERLNKIVSIAQKINKVAKVHIEMETGMHRTGFASGDIDSVCNFLQSHARYIRFFGLFTHFAGAESLANHFRVGQQIQLFRKQIACYEAHGLAPSYIHSACSAAIFNYPDAPGNMVRAGIIQYGFWPNKETQIRYYGDLEKTPDVLKRVISWSTKIMAIEQVPKGKFIGYGTSFLAHKNLRIAVLPIGYAHGYGRKLSNIGSVLIHCKMAPIIGTINMNSMTVDITEIKNAGFDSEVILIGNQSTKSITVNSFSEQSNLLNYEMLTRLSPHIPRIITA